MANVSAQSQPKGLWKILDYLNRLNYAIANPAKKIVDKEKDTPLSILKASWRGLSGQERTTFSDVLGEAGWNPKSVPGKAARGLLGFAMDVGLDPLTYMGIGAFTKAGQASKVAKGIDAAADAARVAQKTKILRAVAIAKRAKKTGNTAIFDKAMTLAKKIHAGTPKIIDDIYKSAGKYEAVIRKGVVKPLADTASKQAELGQRALISLAGRPLVKGSKAIEGLERAGEIIGKTKLGGAAKKMFIPGKTGNKELDDIVEKILPKKGFKEEEYLDVARSFKAAINRVAKERGVTPDEIGKTISQKVELAKETGNSLSRRFRYQSAAKEHVEDLKKIFDGIKSDIGIKSGNIVDVKHISTIKTKITRKRGEARILADKQFSGMLPNLNYGTEDLGDILRGVIFVDNLSQSPAVVKKLSKKLEKMAVETSLVAPRGKWGYRNIHVDGVLPGGQKVEIQIGTPDFWKSKHRAHKIFDIWRDVPEKKLSLGGLTKQSDDIKKSQEIFLAAVNKEAKKIGYKDYRELSDLEDRIRLAASADIGVDVQKSSKVPRAGTHSSILGSNIQKASAPVVPGGGEIHSLSKTPSLSEYSYLGPDISSSIQNILSRGEKVNIDDFAKHFAYEFDKIHRAETGLGIKTAKLTADIGYMPHIGTPEYVKFTNKKKIFGNAKVWSDKHPNQLRRQLGEVIFQDDSRKMIYELTPDEIDKAVKNGAEIHIYTLDEANKWSRAKGFKGDAFYTDPAIAYGIRGVRSARAQAGAEFIQEVKKFGKPAKEAPKDWKEINSELLKDHSFLKGLKFEPEVIDEIERVYQKVTGLEEVNEFLKVYDKVLNWWKGQVLISPGYHLRNVIGNVWNNYLAGVKNPEVYSLAAKIQKTYKGGQGLGQLKSIKIGLPGGRTLNSDALITKARQLDVIGSGWYAADIPTAIEEGIRKGTLKPWKQNNWLFVGNKKVGTYLENQGRLAHFIDRIRKGDSFEDAAKSVKKYLFDYQNLTETERRIFKRIMPFYTWTRKNVPLQLEHLLKEPGKYTAIYKAKTNFEKQQEGVPDETWMSEWMKENAPVRIRKGKDGNWQYFLLDRWLPAADIVKIAAGQESIVGLLSPAIKMPYEHMTNKDLYFGQEIERYAGETGSYLGLKLPKKIIHWLRTIRILNDLNKLNPFNVFGTKEKISIFGNLPKGVVQMPGKERTAGYLLGGKLYPYDVEKGKRWAEYRKRKDISKLKAALKKAIKEGRKEEARKILMLIDKRRKSV